MKTAAAINKITRRYFMFQLSAYTIDYIYLQKRLNIFKILIGLLEIKFTISSN